uniref:DUF6783 domain-containing protein n=1 Tax=Anaerobutyricum hallii TaxID=39488 RepID=UPI003FF13917
MFCLHSVDVARYAALIQAKSPTNCNHKQNRSGCLPEEDKALLILHIYCYRIIFYLRFSHASTYQRHHWW